MQPAVSVRQSKHTLLKQKTGFFSETLWEHIFALCGNSSQKLTEYLKWKHEHQLKFCRSSTGNFLLEIIFTIKTTLSVLLMPRHNLSEQRQLLKISSLLIQFCYQKVPLNVFIATHAFLPKLSSNTSELLIF